MALKQFNPVTPSLRGTVMVSRDGLWKGKPVKGLTEGKSSSGGRNNHGHTHGAVPGRRTQADLSCHRLQAAQVRRAGEGRAAGIRPQPHRTAFIALLKYQDGELAYIIAPQRLAVGDTVVSGQRADIKPGNAMQLAAIPVGTIIHNIEMKPGAGGKVARFCGHLRLSWSARTRATPRSS